MTHLVTVPTLHIGHVLWLRTLFRGVAILLAVAALHDTRLIAFIGLVAFLSTVAACHGATTSGAVLGEMSDLITGLAFNALG